MSGIDNCVNDTLFTFRSLLIVVFCALFNLAISVDTQTDNHDIHIGTLFTWNRQNLVFKWHCLIFSCYYFDRICNYISYLLWIYYSVTLHSVLDINTNLHFERWLQLSIIIECDRCCKHIYLLIKNFFVTIHVFFLGNMYCIMYVHSNLRSSILNTQIFMDWSLFLL